MQENNRKRRVKDMGMEDTWHGVGSWQHVHLYTKDASHMSKIEKNVEN
jgi:hypothetical protein